MTPPIDPAYEKIKNKYQFQRRPLHTTSYFTKKNELDMSEGFKAGTGPPPNFIKNYIFFYKQLNKFFIVT